MKVNEIKITPQIFALIKGTIGNLEPEQGGVLGGTNNVITNYFHDMQLVPNPNVYRPNIKNINNELVRWQRNNIDFVGVIHSHIKGNLRLSYADNVYAQRLMKNNNLSEMIMFIVQSTYDSFEFLIKAFWVSMSCNYNPCKEVNIKIEKGC